MIEQLIEISTTNCSFECCMRASRRWCDRCIESFLTANFCHLTVNWVLNIISLLACFGWYYWPIYTNVLDFAISDYYCIFSEVFHSPAKTKRKVKSTHYQYCCHVMKWWTIIDWEPWRNSENVKMAERTCCRSERNHRKVNYKLTLKSLRTKRNTQNGNICCCSKKTQRQKIYSYL